MSQMSLLERYRQNSIFLSQIYKNRQFQWCYIFGSNLLLLFCIIYQNVNTILFIIRFVKEGGVVWNMLSRFLSCLGLAMSFNYSAFNGKTILKINAETRRIYDNLSMEKVPVLKNLPSAYTFMIVIISYVVFAQTIVTVSFWVWPVGNVTDRDAWVQIFCSSGICDFSALSEDDKDKWYFVDIFLFTLTTVASGMSLNGIYCYGCLTLISFSESTSAALRLERDGLEDAPLNREFVLKCREYWQDVKLVMRLYNDVFSGIFVIWYGVSLVCTCDFLSRYFRNGVEAGNHLNSMQSALYFFVYGQSFVSVAVVSWVSSKLPNMFNRALMEMQTLTLNRRYVSLDVFAELNVLMTQIQTPPTGIEIGGCFLITKAFFVSYLGTIVTFLMIFFQLHVK